MPPRRLSPAERTRFERMSRAVVANPFGAERAELDRALGLERAGGTRTERLARHLAQALAELERGGPVSLRAFAPEEHEVLTHALLFDLYHAWSGPLAEHIAAQEDSPDEPVSVPFASECRSALERRGFDGAAALKYLALFFQLRRAYAFIDRALVGESACMQALREALWNDIFTRDLRGYEAFLWERMEDFSTLLLGETGTGKGSAAAAIGRSGFVPFDEKRGRFGESFARAFVPLNLAEFPESLIESELFGHEKGAFTGAQARRDGVFAVCSPHGSIFLDEIGELSAPVQIKLLRVLQERVFTPVGSRKTQRFRGRVIAATNRRLEELRSGLLREDPFYRLCTDVIVVPPLRVRLEEEPAELERLVGRILERTLGPTGAALVDRVCALLAEEPGPGYPWPGNVRELEQCVRRILLKGRAEVGAAAPAGAEGDAFLERVAAGTLDADALLGGYCTRLLAQVKSYEEVARRTRLDRRTVKRYVGLDGGARSS